MASIRCANTAFCARSFIKLAQRQYSLARAQPTTPFDFLLPRRAYTSSTLLSQNASSHASLSTRRTAPLRSSRGFSTSPVRFITRCIRNPQNDEDGNEMSLEITPRAAKRLSEIMTKEKNPDLALRVQVESGGCHGFQYLMSLITIPPKDASSSSLINEDDSIFQYSPDDADPVSTGPRVILDEPSLDLLKGSKVDFTMELIGSQFKIVDNPYATSSCGCGTSFDIKM